MITTGYKIVTQELSSAYVQKEFKIQYKLNSWVCASITSSLLFGFEHECLAHIASTSTDLIYKCEFFDAVHITILDIKSTPLTTIPDVEVWWLTHDLKNIGYGGLLVAKAIRLRELV